MTALAHNHYHIAFQYALASQFTGFVRPYEAGGSGGTHVEMFLSDAALPQANHHRVELLLRLHAVTADGRPMFEASVHLEAIVLLAEGMTPDDQRATLRTEVAAALAGSARSTLTGLMAPTGFGMTVLPPFNPKQLALLPPLPLASEGS